MARQKTQEESLTNLLKKHGYDNLVHMLRRIEEDRNIPLTKEQKAEKKKYVAISKEAERVGRTLDHVEDVLWVDYSGLTDAMAEASASLVEIAEITEDPAPGHPMEVDQEELSQCWGDLRKAVKTSLREVKKLRKAYEKANQKLDMFELRLEDVAEYAKGKK
ncbi:hypothetical protein DRQ25_05215 [Candidatus Fermentibacteria bacterium]|nr:MAG: hypothetical protein DRQ25_05215 [Candidatus Fermentibacteria bacterium]